jgi:hypothetical protein
MHKLVVVGDSLSQGFQSGAIWRTHLSYPAMLANAMGIPEDGFRVPDFSGGNGLPLNLEQLVRLLADEFGPKIDDVIEAAKAASKARTWMDQTEDYWESGEGNAASQTGPLHHNLSVWGFEVLDAVMVTEEAASKIVGMPFDNLIFQIPGKPMYRTARRTLNPSKDSTLGQLTQMEAAKKLAADGGVENLVVWLGANNCLGTVTSLKIHPSDDDDLTLPSNKRTCNLWLPQHFDQIYDKLEAAIKHVPAEHVFVATIPHVTIPPVTRGVNANGQGPAGDDGYFDYYVRPWIWDDEFNPAHSRPKLSRKQAKQIDEAIDAYNQKIKTEAGLNGWHVVDVCAMLDSLAYRRQQGTHAYVFPEAFVEALKANDALSYLVDADRPGGVGLDTRFLWSDQPGKLAKGGLFSLDGVHPTTIGYALIANEFLGVMNDAWEQAGKPRHEPTADWWSRCVDADTLVKDPPINLTELRKLLGFLDQWTGFEGVIELLGNGGAK